MLPAEVIPAADRLGLTATIDAFVLDEACRQLAAWTSTSGGDEQLTLAVNISVIRLRDPVLSKHIATVLNRHRIAPQRLCLEIAENALIGADQAVASLSALGVRIALDNFGTGYSTLAHFKHGRADILKLDRKFLLEISDEPRDREIIAALTTMAHALGMSVVGQGIEAATELDALAALHCDTGQGFLFTEALPPDDIPKIRLSSPSGGETDVVVPRNRLVRAGFVAG